MITREERGVEVDLLEVVSVTDIDMEMSSINNIRNVHAYHPEAVYEMMNKLTFNKHYTLGGFMIGNPNSETRLKLWGTKHDFDYLLNKRLENIKI